MPSIDEAKLSNYEYMPSKNEQYIPGQAIVTVIIDCYYKLDLVKQSIQSVLNHPKNLVWENTGKPLTLNEHLEYKFSHTEQYKNSGIKIINLSKEEILAIVEEGWKRLEGTWVDTKNDIEEQKKFWSVLINHRYSSRYHGYIHHDAKISSIFLRNNVNFFR